MYYYQRLRDLREDADKTQQEVANYLGIIQVQYHRYETGKREVPFHLVIKLAEYYRVSIDYIAGLTNDKRGLTQSTLNDDETKLCRGFAKLDANDKARILERIDTMLEIQGNAALRQ